MNEDRTSTQQETRYWVGLDWGGEGHAVSVVNDGREARETFRIGTSLSALEELAKRLHAFGPVAGIAIEATCNPVVHFLLSMGFTIYPINPKMSKNWRECDSVAGVKNDERDGLVLAVELARRHESLRPLKRGDLRAVELAGLCEKVRELIDERTALIQRLKAVLGQYYPGALAQPARQRGA